FQENILICDHPAITQSIDSSDWVLLMISKEAFPPENTRVEAEIKLGPKGHGLGFLFSHPEAVERAHINEGYCLWISSEHEKSKKTKLLRSSISVVEAPDIQLKCEEWQKVRIEKIDEHIYFYFNDILQFSYVGHVPVIGSHIGLLAKDADFEIRNFSVSIGSQRLIVGCLAVPDAFLANKDYERALSEYRRIGTAFPGRQEGRDALFKAGITLLEEAKATHKKDLFDAAYREFEKLSNTPGAP